LRRAPAALRADAPWYFALGEGARLWDHEGFDTRDLIDAKALLEDP
jgi:hypothetical protein